MMKTGILIKIIWVNINVTLFAKNTNILFGICEPYLANLAHNGVCKRIINGLLTFFYQK